LDHIDPTADFPVKAFNHIVGSQPPSMRLGECHIGQQILGSIAQQLRCRNPGYLPEMARYFRTVESGERPSLAEEDEVP
jgi:hypothetical protein